MLGLEGAGLLPWAGSLWGDPFLGFTFEKQSGARHTWKDIIHRV